jgi:alpha-1,2-mannosyltransferase
MQRFINNLLYSKAPLMVVLRYVLVALIVIMGITRLRLILILIAYPNTYMDRDTLTYFLMAKAILAGLNPYLPLNELALKFVGSGAFLTHPAPTTTTMALLFIPLTIFGYDTSVVIWLIIELLLLAAIAYLLPFLWNGKRNVLVFIFLFFLLLAWYPVMVDLLLGQLSIMLTFFLLVGLLAIRRGHKVLGGVLLGVSVAIKMITWPLIVYFALKKEWKTVLSSILTILSLNIISVFIIGVNPMLEYYLRISTQVSVIYHGFLKNYSLWSIGYRFFEGTGPTGDGYISAPPLISLPHIAPFVSAGLAVAFLVIGLIWAMRCKDLDIAYSIMICVLIAISPIAWDHYYVMLIISLVVLLHDLWKHSFPTWPTLIFMIIALSFLLINDQIDGAVLLLNSGELLKATGYQITFATSLLEVVPILELIVLTILLWQRGIAKNKAQNTEIQTLPVDVETN